MSDSFSQSEEFSTSDDSEYNFIPGIWPGFLDHLEVENPDEEAVQENGDYLSEPYADEPLADEEWIREYELEQTKKTQELLERKSRLDGSVQLSSWCKCGHCKTDLLQNPNECYCCQEIEKCVDILGSDEVLQETRDPPACVTLHPAFPILCLNKWSLKSAALKYRRIDRTKYSQTGLEETFLRSVSYREFVQLVYGHLGDTRLPLPACAYSKIRSTFSSVDKNDSFTGFEEDN